MCLIIARPANKPDAFITDEDLYRAVDRNYDGIGVMYPVQGKLHVEYKLGTIQEVMDFYREHEAKATGAFAAHLRYATDGKVSTDNCHPHKILDQEDGDRNTVYMMHNGIIAKHKTSKTADESDTVKFIREIMRPLMERYSAIHKVEAFKALVGDYIGYSKLLFMDNRGRIQIVNKDLGIERNGMWLSNDYSVTNDSKTKAGAVTRTRGGVTQTWNSVTGKWEDNKPWSYSYGSAKTTSKKVATTSNVQSLPNMKPLNKYRKGIDMDFKDTKWTGARFVDEYFHINDKVYLYFERNATIPYFACNKPSYVVVNQSKIDEDKAKAEEFVDQYEDMVCDTLMYGTANEIYDVCDDDIETVVKLLKESASRTYSSKFLRRHIKKGLGYFKDDNYLTDFVQKVIGV